MKKRVLVLSCGSLTATDMSVSLKDNDEYELWGTSIYKDHGIYTYKNYIPDIPKISESNFIQVLNQKIKKYNISYLVPTHEDMCLFLQENKEKIKDYKHDWNIAKDEKWNLISQLGSFWRNLGIAKGCKNQLNEEQLAQYNQLTEQRGNAVSRMHAASNGVHRTVHETLSALC